MPLEEVDESIVLVRLAVMPVRDMADAVGIGFGVSGGEKGVWDGCGTSGELGVFGKGFSTFRSLFVPTCFFRRGWSELGVSGLDSWIVAGDARSPTCMFVGLYCPPEMEPNFLIPLRTQARKSPLSGEASEFSSSELTKNLDSSEPMGRRVSLSAMIDHAGGEQDGGRQGGRGELRASLEAIACFIYFRDGGREEGKETEHTHANTQRLTVQSDLAHAISRRDSTVPGFSVRSAEARLFRN